MNPEKRDATADLAAVRATLDADPRLAWLLRQKVTVPEPVPGYMARDRLLQRAMPTRRRLTAIVAPGGFGKTTLLAECCRRLAGEGVAAAWLAVDGDESGDVLDAYLAFALRYAGLDVGDDTGETGGADEAEYGRAARLLRGIEAAEAPCVLALDDLQRLSDPQAVALVEFLVRRGPPNLHLAVACRRLPETLDVGGAVLSRTASALTAGDLRFTSAEIGEFFGKTLSRRKLAAVKRESGGWPMALRIHRNRAEAEPAPDERQERDIVRNWVESRLWEGMDGGDRALLLDAGLFEWMDGDLLAEALGARDAMRRIEGMDALAGLLYPVRHGARESWRLHPLIREHCARERLREDRGRYRALNGRIAAALARRGETLQALRHAAESGDGELGGRILEEAGAVRLWIRYGVAAFQAAVGRLEEPVLVSTPRLRLARCAWLLFAGRLPEARLAYVTLPAPGPAPAGGPEDPVWVDDRLVQGFLGFYGGESAGSERARTMMADYGAIAASPAVERLVRGYAEHVVCVGCNAMGAFDIARERAERALARLGGNPYGRMLVGFQLGQIAMARGRVEAAGKHYAKALRAAKARVLDDPASIAIAEVLQRELALERHERPPPPNAGGVPAALTRHGTPALSYAAACGAAVGRALCADGADAPAVARDLLERAQEAGLPVIARYLSALRVSVLAAAGRAAEAERFWGEVGLPGDDAACLDREGQTWREMEAVACARLRLSIAQERIDEARAFGEALCEASAVGGLRRTRMRALVLTVVLEERAGEPERKRRRLQEFLSLFAETDYAWAAVCERRVLAPAVERFLEDAGDSRLRAPAVALLERMRGAEAAPPQGLSEREWQVLSRLADKSDQTIAADLGLTTDGVRYHLRNLFSKLGTNSRNDAVRRAREAGLIR